MASVVGHQGAPVMVGRQVPIAMIAGVPWRRSRLLNTVPKWAVNETVASGHADQQSLFEPRLARTPTLKLHTDRVRAVANYVDQLVEAPCSEAVRYHLLLLLLIGSTTALVVFFYIFFTHYFAPIRSQRSGIRRSIDQSPSQSYLHVNLLAFFRDAFFSVVHTALVPR